MDASAGANTADLPAGNEKILLVEDNADVQSIVVTMLEQLGYRIVTADTADQAMDILSNRQDIALVLSDIVMPGCFDGIAMARRLRQDYKHLPVLLTTGYAKAVSEPLWNFPCCASPIGCPNSRMPSATHSTKAPTPTLVECRGSGVRAGPTIGPVARRPHLGADRVFDPGGGDA